MRAIDGDALIKALIRKEPFNDCARVVIAECIEEVRHAPTIKQEVCEDAVSREAENYANDLRK